MGNNSFPDNNFNQADALRTMLEELEQGMAANCQVRLADGTQAYIDFAMLMICSPVLLKRVFTAQSMQSVLWEVPLPEVTHENFLRLRRYMYTGSTLVPYAQLDSVVVNCRQFAICGGARTMNVSMEGTTVELNRSFRWCYLPSPQITFSAGPTGPVPNRRWSVTLTTPIEVIFTRLANESRYTYVLHCIAPESAEGPPAEQAAGPSKRRKRQRASSAHKVAAPARNTVQDNQIDSTGIEEPQGEEAAGEEPPRPAAEPMDVSEPMNESGTSKQPNVYLARRSVPLPLILEDD